MLLVQLANELTDDLRGCPANQAPVLEVLVDRS